MAKIYEAIKGIDETEGNRLRDLYMDNRQLAHKSESIIRKTHDDLEQKRKYIHERNRNIDRIRNAHTKREAKLLMEKYNIILD